MKLSIFSLQIFEIRSTALSTALKANGFLRVTKADSWVNVIMISSWWNYGIKRVGMQGVKRGNLLLFYGFFYCWEDYFGLPLHDGGGGD